MWYSLGIHRRDCLSKQGGNYNPLFKASSETLFRIAADPKHLGARIGITSVLHTWGSAMTHPPHVHMIVPGKPSFFLPVRRIGSFTAGPCRCRQDRPSP